MIEKLGAMAFLILFAIFFLPAGLDYYTENVKANKVLNASEEFRQFLISEGDINGKVKGVVNDLDKKGLKITFYDESGNEINSRSNIGEKVFVKYEYDGYVLSNSAVLTKR